MDGDAAADRVARLLGEAGLPIPMLGSLDEVQPAVLPVASTVASSPTGSASGWWGSRRSPVAGAPTAGTAPGA
ncbi:MAG TPA: hypothetical protein VIV08_07260, partial [Acidimicrobiia bacterium]